MTMPKQEKTERRSGRETTAEEIETKSAEPPSRANLDADVDSILDEIDEVLEKNAEDFVKSFVQKGGQ